MWGRGQEGQLGVGTHQDSSHPRAVELLQGRKVLQVCGCRHSCELHLWGISGNLMAGRGWGFLVTMLKGCKSLQVGHAAALAALPASARACSWAK